MKTYIIKKIGKIKKNNIHTRINRRTNPEASILRRQFLDEEREEELSPALVGRTNAEERSRAAAAFFSAYLVAAVCFLTDNDFLSRSMAEKTKMKWKWKGLAEEETLTGEVANKKTP